MREDSHISRGAWSLQIRESSLPKIHQDTKREAIASLVVARRRSARMSLCGLSVRCAGFPLPNGLVGILLTKVGFENRIWY